MELLSRNYFELFGLSSGFAIDLNLLDLNYRKLQSEVHPDRFVSSSPSDRMQSMQIATQANEAYRTLKNPTARARYLLQLQGIETLEESNTAMPADFLMLQMEWRETAEDAEAARDIGALDGLLGTMREMTSSLHGQLLIALEDNQLTLAAEIVRKLSFIDKLRADVEQTIEKLED
ncbi:MAG TPA: Fe-S protein assembly co-chaperone HscB [Methylophilaceae bacterium]|nr:Fe-S protein assembly co-chaperone HscB [Methylophilaceae bacterium]